MSRRAWNGTHLPPSAFAFVMATGIISAALDDVDQHSLSIWLLLLAAIALAVLVVVLLAGIIRDRTAVLRDLLDPAVCFGFFTLVAALNVVGVGYFSPGRIVVTAILAGTSVPVWLMLSYGLPASLMLTRRGPAAASAADGSWLLWVVGTQSLSISASVLAPAGGSLLLAEVAVALWGIGVLLYLMLSTLVTLRLLGGEGHRNGIVPADWIYMGATAITVLAGAHLLALPAGDRVLQLSAPVVSGLSLLLWAFGLWWVPLLVIFEFWRNAVRHGPVRYSTGWWSIVFPLGMFAVASDRFGKVAGLPDLTTVGAYASWVAGVAWLVVAVSMLAAGYQWWRRPPDRLPKYCVSRWKRR